MQVRTQAPQLQVTKRARIRERAHAVGRVMAQWQHELRVHGDALAPSLWGGTNKATFEVTPAGAAQAATYHMQPRD